MDKKSYEVSDVIAFTTNWNIEDIDGISSFKVLKQEIVSIEY